MTQTESIAEQKAVLREQSRLHRRSIRPDITLFDAASDLFFERLKPSSGDIIAAYWPCGSEFDVRPVIERLLHDNIPCALPVLHEGRLQMDFALWKDGTKLEKGPHGTFQPPAPHELCKPDIVLVPLLAFDRYGYRLGQGGGYYDKTLAALRETGTIKAVGMGYAEQACLFRLPAEEHDQKLDWMITPQQAIEF